MLDFTPIIQNRAAILEFSRNFTPVDLHSALHEYLDILREIVETLSDEQVCFIPHDPHADDPHAPEPERYQGWSVAHVVLHVTATCEEYAAHSSLVARGVLLPKGTRLRYEPDWHTVTTQAQVLARLEECRRICTSYLDTYPDEPHLTLFREMNETSPYYGKLNAIGSFLLGLRHLSDHLEQVHETARQAGAAVSSDMGQDSGQSHER